MFIVDLNQQTNTIQVKTNDETNPTVVAQGNFAVDVPDCTALVYFNHVKIEADNHQELGQLISIVVSHVGQLYKSLICIRLPSIFDGRIDFDKIEFKNTIPEFMSVTFKDLKYYPENNLQDKQEEYELITEKELIFNYAEGIKTMMNREAFWAKKWNLNETQNRINSATNIAMILDKKTNIPCGFGRLFLLRTNEDIFGYLSDIGIDSSHQSKGLGRILFNYLVGICASQDVKQKWINGTLCLQCAFEGSGAISAPKLYRRSGFECVNQIGNRIAIFSNRDHYHATYE
jgi:ribosomal protein S18 acetylase RimI-like enzyme